MSTTPVAGAPRDRLDLVVVCWLTLLVMISTVVAVFFLPLYVGTVPLPVSALLGAAVVFVAIRLSYRLTTSMPAALAPAVGWLVTAVYLSFSKTLGYPLVIGDWRATMLLGVGALAAAMGVGLSWGTHQLALVDRSGAAGAGLDPVDPAAGSADVPAVTADRSPNGS